jgi:hypothetical protein
MKQVRIRSFLPIALAMASAFLAAPNSTAQQTASDRFEITLTNPVTVGNKVLQPGIYSVEPLTLAGGDAPVLSISNDGGVKLETSAMVSPALQNRIQPETRVVLRQVGQRYYFDKIWVKGLSYRYRFKLPKAAKAGAGGNR